MAQGVGNKHCVSIGIVRPWLYLGKPGLSKHILRLYVRSNCRNKGSKYVFVDYEHFSRLYGQLSVTGFAWFMEPCKFVTSIAGNI